MSIETFSLNLSTKLKNLPSSSALQILPCNSFYLLKISSNLPLTYEKVATPLINKIATKILSSSLLGTKSPKPTVERLVKAK